MEFIPQELDDYCTSLTSKETEILYKLNRETHLKVLIPRMLSGHLQGRVLSMFSYMIKPMNVLEIGTYTGYSAICLAEGMQKNGKLITIDINNELETMATNYFEKSGFSSQIEMKIGNAMEIIPSLDMKFDLVFIDADKTNYSNYFDLVIDKMNSGGFIIADNVLWSGKVITEEAKTNADTKALVEYSKKIHKNTRVENVLLPIRDGLMVARVL